MKDPLTRHQHACRHWPPYCPHCRCWHGLRPTATVTVKVTVVAPLPCMINDDRPIEVEFGDVMTTRVDGDNYKMPVNYTLSCTGPASNAMKLQVKGTGAAF
ncbi:putative minor fimbrial subunit StfE [Serratia fonticola]|uniref:Putative minor fimbrial subunit StfE n=1 Tax=Serratia fonticola TaxID=47917 RepID=A0A4U9TWB7_SERFO|nr:putative minor fimbrial subunit StfE [Serratia fonticola]